VSTVSRRPLAFEFTELVGQQVRWAIASVRDPRARALRRRRRARRFAAVYGGTAAVAGTVTATLGSLPGVLEVSEIAGGSVTALALLGAGTAGIRALRLHRTPLPAPASPPLPAPASPPLPPSGSAARAPLARLASADAGLDELLALLARPRHGVPALSPDSAASIRDAAAEAGVTLRTTAESLHAVERTVPTAPPGERAALAEAVHLLAERLDEGVDELSRLVSAAGHAVAAGSAGTPRAGLTEATDRLSGLAAGLRELAEPHWAHRPTLSSSTHTGLIDPH
jgi:hypothetical protein